MWTASQTPGCGSDGDGEPGAASDRRESSVATGATSRDFPWEGLASVFKPELADDRKTYVVGSNPTNYSQLGVADMAGNAWEYVSNSYDERVTPTDRVRGIECSSAISPKISPTSTPATGSDRPGA